MRKSWAKMVNYDRERSHTGELYMYDRYLEDFLLI